MTVALGCALLLAASGCDSAVGPDVRPPETFSVEAFQVQAEHFVEWNAETKVDALTAANYNDGERTCWNGGFKSAACTDLGL